MSVTRIHQLQAYMFRQIFTSNCLARLNDQAATIAAKHLLLLLHIILYLRSWLTCWLTHLCRSPFYLIRFSAVAKFHIVVSSSLNTNTIHTAHTILVPLYRVRMYTCLEAMVVSRHQRCEQWISYILSLLFFHSSLSLSTSLRVLTLNSLKTSFLWPFKFLLLLLHKVKEE